MVGSLLSAVCWAIWIVTNQITFDKKVVRSHVITIFATCEFLRYWAGLYEDDDKVKIVNETDQMMHKASQLANLVAGAARDVQAPSAGRILLTNG
jgi:hypothetical protein